MEPSFPAPVGYCRRGSPLLVLRGGWGRIPSPPITSGKKKVIETDVNEKVKRYWPKFIVIIRDKDLSHQGITNIKHFTPKKDGT